MTANTPSDSFNGGGHIDATLAALQAPVRRKILEYTAAADSAVSLDELVDVIQQESDLNTAREVKSILYHNHLPRLENIGAIAYDANEQQVWYTTDPDLISRLVETLRETA